MKSLRKKIVSAILRQQVTSRGGGVEITLKPWGFRDDAKMAAYQNYLGGGMLGAVQTNHNIFRTSFTPTETRKLERIAKELAQYFHELTNPDTEWEGSSFEENQRRPASAY